MGGRTSETFYGCRCACRLKEGMGLQLPSTDTAFNERRLTYKQVYKFAAVSRSTTTSRASRKFKLLFPLQGMRPSSDVVLHISRIECKKERIKDFLIFIRFGSCEERRLNLALVSFDRDGTRFPPIGKRI